MLASKPAKLTALSFALVLLGFVGWAIAQPTPGFPYCEVLVTTKCPNCQVADWMGTWLCLTDDPEPRYDATCCIGPVQGDCNPVPHCSGYYIGGDLRYHDCSCPNPTGCTP